MGEEREGQKIEQHFLEATFHSQFTVAHPVSFGNPGRRWRSVFFRKLTHILVTVPCQIRQSWTLGRWEGGGGGGESRTKFE